MRTAYVSILRFAGFIDIKGGKVVPINVRQTLLKTPVDVGPGDTTMQVESSVQNEVAKLETKDFSFVMRARLHQITSNLYARARARMRPL